MDAFDTLAQALARGLSRRQALQRFAGGVGAAIVGTVLPWRVPAEASAAGPRHPFAYDIGSGGSMPAGSKVPTLRNGDGGPKVKAMQHLLNEAGDDIPADGDFGPVTTDAVRKFQGKVGLNPVNGVVYDATWWALFVPLENGAEGQGVLALQELLNNTEFGTEPDGWFGDHTQEMVEAFQKSQGLPSNGKVSTATWFALVEQ